MLSEISQRKPNTVWLHLYVESKKQNKWTNITKQKLTHRYREQTGGCQRGGVEGWGVTAFNLYKFSFWGDEKNLKLDRGDNYQYCECTKCHWIVHFKMVSG